MYEQLRSGGFCTELAGAREPVAPATDELERQRAAARRGCAIERAVIMVDRSRRHDADVRELIARDERAGIRHVLVDAVNALPPAVDGARLRFGVWDEGMFTNGDGSVSRLESDVRYGVEAAAALRSASGDPRELVLDEPLARSARLGRELAPELCREASRTGVDCTSYHGLVQYLRLLGVAASPQRHGHFYREALTPLARAVRQPRVLIAATADTSMLIHVLSACGAAGANADVTVNDRCATPLELCRRYAHEHGLELRTARCDVVDFHDATPFDAICTESLLTLLPPAARRAAIAQWRSLLRPGGRFVTSARIGGPGSGEPDPLRADAFAGWVRNEAERRRELLDLDPETLAEEARRYYGSVPLHPVGSREELTGLFTHAGMTIERLDFVQLDGRGPGGPGAAGHYRSAEYARIVAVR